MLGAAGMTTLTRIGFAARGVMYFLIGYLSLRGGHAEDGTGALAYIASGPGKLLLVLMAIGFFAYGVWRLSEALIDSEGNGAGASGAAKRVGGAISGVIHLGLGAVALRLGSGTGGAGSGGTQEGAQTALGVPGGELALIAAALVLVVTGIAQFAKVWKGGFLKQLDPKAAQKAWVKWLGRAGYSARGIVFVVVGALVWRAARESDPSEAGGVAEALTSLPSGIAAAVAAGLLLFGIFSLVEARYRRINDPHVLDRMKGAVHSARS